MKKMMLLLLPLAAFVYAWEIIGEIEHTQNIRNYLTMKLGPVESWHQYPYLIVEFSKDAVKPYGYMNAQVKLNLKQKTLHIDPGEATVFNNPKISLTPECTGIQPMNAQLQDIVYRNDVYISLKNDLLNQAHDAGYYDALVTGNVLISHGRADVDLHLACHHIYTLTDINVTSPFSTDLYVRHAEKYLNKPTGTRDFISFKNRIRSRTELGLHEITEKKNTADHSVAWRVINRKAPEDQRSMGAGFVSGKGFDLMLKYSSISQPKAHSLSVLSHLSTQSIDGQVVYAIPSRLFLDGTHSIRLFHEIFPNRRFDQVSSSEANYRLVRQNENLQTEYGLSLQLNRDQPSDEVINSFAFYPYIQQKHDWIHCNTHTQVTFLIKGSTRILGSQFNFISGDITLNHRSQVTTKILAKANVQLAGIYGSDLQNSWLYRTGGPTSVTGYPVDSIGPGSFINVGRMGLFYPITSNWYLGYWLTTGSATSTLLSDIKIGHAIAADMQTPMGAIELSIGKAAGHGLQFALTLLPL